MAMPGRKTVQSTGRRGILIVALFGLCFFLHGSSATGQLIDSLDVYPPRWSLEESDCDARVTEQGHVSDPAAEGGSCENVTLLASHGTKAVLVYPIEPVRPIDELTSSVRVKGLHAGLRIGFRVRFPYIMDEKTKRPASVIIYGSAYQRIGEFQRLGVSDIVRDLKLKQVALRNEFGMNADVASPYVDAVVLNVYGGPGSSSVRIDELRVEAMVPLIDEVNPSESAALANQGVAGTGVAGTDFAKSIDRMNARPALDSSREALSAIPRAGLQNRLSLAGNPAYVLGKITRILQYNGEPLSWVRSLGFDAVWLDSPPTSSILSEAISARLRIYAPAPSSPDPRLQPLLEPVAAWVVSGDRAMDSTHWEAITQDIRRLRAFPLRWQRRLVGCPVESYREYSSMLDAIILDTPPRIRNLSGIETKAFRARQLIRANGKPVALGVSSTPNPVAVDQTDAIGRRIGTPACESFQWHGMWRQVADGLSDGVSAVLYRSSQSLAAGTPLQQNRAMALSYVNRFIAAIGPWVAGSTPDSMPMMIRDAATSQPLYVGHRFAKGASTMMIMTSAMHRGDATLAGDGKSISFSLPPEDEGKMAWRLTHFSAERLTPETTSSGTKIEIVSPDVVEVIAISSELSEAGKLAASAQRYARQAALDRWQLAGDAIMRSRATWDLALAGRVVDRSPPLDLLQVAQSSLSSAEELVRGGEADASLRLSRRADAWVAKADWMLHDALIEGVNPNDPIASKNESEPSPFMPGRYVSSPPLVAGNLETQIAWSPLLKTPINPNLRIAPSVSNQAGGRSRWGSNLIASGDFERANVLSGKVASGDPSDSADVFDGASVLEREGWTLGKRHSKWASCEASWIDRGAFSGKGAMRLRVTPRGEGELPGGYEGTCMMVRSPAVRLPASSVVRIDAVVRTLGFNHPHQGLLIYDDTGSQEMGVLVGPRSEWTPVTLFRQTGEAGDLHVMMEVVGGGEAIVDQVQVRVWETVEDPTREMRPIDAALLSP